jgi:hypothetical protein
MSGLGKKFVLMLLCVLLVSSVFLVEQCVAPVTTPTNPIPAPEVSVVVNANHFWNTPTYTSNPYTGESMQTAQGYWIPDGTIDITIKNRSFISYTDENGNYVSVFYSVFVKTESSSWSQYTSPKYTVYQSNSDYTIITFTYGSGRPNSLASDNLWVLKEGEVRNFRVQAVTGYFSGDSFEGEGSEWVEFTVTIPTSDKPDVSTPIVPSAPNMPSFLDPNNPPPQNTSQRNSLQSNLIVILVFVCVITVLLVVIVYLYSRQRKSKNLSSITEFYD